MVIEVDGREPLAKPGPVHFWKNSPAGGVLAEIPTTVPAGKLPLLRQL